MPEYVEFPGTTSEIERIKLNSDGCNLNTVSVSVSLLYILYFCMLCMHLPPSHNIYNYYWNL